MTLMQIALKNIRRRISKMTFILLGLVIGISTIVSVYSILEIMKTDMTKHVSEYGANTVLTADTGEIAFTYGGINIPEVLYDVKKMTMEDISVIDQLPLRSMIRVISPKIFGVLQIKEQNVIVSGSDLKSDFALKPWFKLKNDSDITNNSEIAPTESTEDGEYVEAPKLDLTRMELTSLPIFGSNILLGAVIAQNLDLNTGDSLELNGQVFSVVGILQENATQEDYQILMDIAAAQDLLGRPGEVNVIELGLDYSLGSEDILLAQIKTALPEVKITNLRKASLGQDEMLSNLTRFGVSVSILILLIGMLVVALTMSAAVRERTREIGIFRAIGFRKSHIVKIILIEGFFISVIGGIIGYITGMAVTIIAVPLLVDNSLTVQWHPWLLLAAIALSVIIGALASLYPANLATKLDPVIALRFI